MGLTLDYSVRGKHNFTIVKDGRMVDADYFSEDFDTFALRIPAKMDSSIFFMSLNHKEDIFAHNVVDKNDVEVMIKEALENKTDLLTAKLQYSSTQEISKIDLNYDVQILEVTVRGPLAERSIVGQEPVPIQLIYTCKRSGVSSIQLTFNLELFKNINIFFEKKCPVVPGEGSSSVLSWIAQLFFLLLLILAGVTLYNVYAKNMRGISAVPFASDSLRAIAKIPVLRDTSVGRSL